MRFKVSAQNLGGKFTTEKVVFMLYVAEILPHNENSTISRLGVQLVGLPVVKLACCTVYSSIIYVNSSRVNFILFTLDIFPENLIVNGQVQIDLQPVVSGQSDNSNP